MYCLYTCVFIHTHTHTHTVTRTHARTHSHTHTQSHARTLTRTHTHTHGYLGSHSAGCVMYSEWTFDPRDWGGVINNTDIQAVWFMSAVCLCFYSGSKVFQLLVRLAVKYFLLWSCGLTSISLASVLGRSGKYEICFILDWWSGGFVLMRWELKCMYLLHFFMFVRWINLIIKNEFLTVFNIFHIIFHTQR